MSHVRTQIRAAAVLALTGLATSGANVFSQPLQTLADGDLPGLLVRVGDEAVTALTMTEAPLLQRQPELVVACVAKANATLYTVLETMAEEVETAMQAAGDFGGLLKGTPVLNRVSQIEPERLDKPVGVLELGFAIEYHTTAGQPGTAL